jgi:hypothetical protein
MARVRWARSALDVRAVLRLYVERVPQVGFEALARNFTLIAYDEESRAFRFASAAGT